MRDDLDLFDRECESASLKVPLKHVRQPHWLLTNVQYFAEDWCVIGWTRAGIELPPRVFGGFSIAESRLRQYANCPTLTCIAKLPEEPNGHGQSQEQSLNRGFGIIIIGDPAMGWFWKSKSANWWPSCRQTKRS